MALGIVASALTGCSSAPGADCSTALPSGAASELVSATGKIGSRPEITLPTPVDTASSQRSILTEGSGEKVHSGQVIEVQYTILNGKTGEVMQKSTYDKTTYPLALASADSDNSALSRGLQCAPVGSRVAVVLSPEDTDNSGGNTVSGVFVLDVLKAYLPAANGAVRPSVSGFPTVVLAPSGQPGITISSGSAPTAARSETLKTGDGAEVKANSQVILHYTAVGWDNKNVVMSTWQNGTPDIVDVGTGQSAVNQALPADVLKPLVGQKVGTQLVIEAPESGDIPAAAWVVDILGVR